MNEGKEGGRREIRGKGGGGGGGEEKLEGKEGGGRREIRGKGGGRREIRRR